MLRTDLLDLVNHGDMWAFIGSGASVDSGCPTWSGLVQVVLKNVQDDERKAIQAHGQFAAANKAGNYPKIFSIIEKIIERDKLEAAVKTEIKKAGPPRQLAQLIADWPFAAYITTNYDTILQQALEELGRTGWTSVGNTDTEINKVSGDARRLVWHVHGSCQLPRAKSKLILTEEDYDSLYLHSSPVIEQLKALLALRRVIFIGFGFKDPEVVRLLRQVGTFCSPARPAYAFLSGIAGGEHADDRKELLERYNVDVIPYRIRSGTHRELVDVLSVYTAMVLRRSLRYGQPLRDVPSYDPETTGLLLYNELTLKASGFVSENALNALLRARLLSSLKYQGSRTVGELLSELSERTRVITGKATASEQEIRSVIEVLRSNRLIDLVTDGDSEVINLTKAGNAFVGNQAGKAELLADQFLSSLQTRAKEHLPDNEEAAEQTAKVAEAFLKECIDRRALGIAMARTAWEKPQQDYHMVALLQALPDFMSQLATSDEALALTRVVQGVLQRPTDAEATYIGLALQSKFGVHLLGYDADTFRTRTKELSETLFLLDATTVIPLLARSSPGNPPAVLLVERLKKLGSLVATTELLTEEVAEHARYAQRRAGEGLAYTNIDLLKAATGREGERLNVFLAGFLEEVAKGAVAADFAKYIGQICDSCKKGRNVTDHDVQLALDQKYDIPSPRFDEWEGFTEDFWHERHEKEREIAAERKARDTYKHDRQVRAEAEALVVVQNVRKQLLKLNGNELTNAFFVSHTRVIDEVAGFGLRVTLRPASVLQWTAALTGCGTDELMVLTNSLIWELSERGFEIVDTMRIRTTFKPLISAAKEKLEEELQQHRALISGVYGEESANAFSRASDEEIPVMLESLYAQKVDQLAEKLEKETALRQQIQAAARITEKDRAELSRLRAGETRRRALARSNARRMPLGRKRKVVLERNKKEVSSQSLTLAIPTIPTEIAATRML